MILKKCILTANSCYIKNQKMTGNKPTGIVVHSTGANNKTLKRYVQPLKTDADYPTIIADIGTNIYNNHWNKSATEMKRSVCVHGFIGVNANGQIETYQTLPFDICCWGVGSGSKGSYNYNPQARVQFEICEDGLTDETYFYAAMKEAQEFCAFLCKTYGFGIDKICSHAESHKQGYGSNHGDPDHWLKKFGKDMNWFRSEVLKLLTEVEDKNDVASKILYRVQVGAFAVKSNADNMLQKLKAAGFDGFIVTVNKTVTEEPAKIETPTVLKKTVDELAKEVINGKWGNGAARKTALTNAGYSYSAVQARVNELLK